MRRTKFLSFILAVVMVMTCLAVAGVSTSAASGDVVYFDNSVTNFSTVYCYVYNSDDDKNAIWPGEQMTNVSGDIWAYSISGDYSKIIFNSGQGGTQSDDLDYPGNNQIATPNDSNNKFGVSWKAYTGSDTVPTKPTSATSPTTSGGGSNTGVGTVYCQNDANWSTVYCYMWNNGSSDENASWPGEKMTNIGDNVWEYNYRKNYANVIFNIGSNATQTDNLVLPGDSYIYNNSKNTWEPYSSGPVKITALTTDLESPSYTGVSVVISATAKSTDGGNLTYKFTVKDQNGGETTISDGASSTAAWIPTSAGKYKITVDVKDTAGNENSRSIDFEVKDATALEEAFIAAFSNSLGTRTQIKQNSNITFTLNAIGGHTGNGLLFYKFVVTDPDGGNNVAYYTTSNAYSYTPTKLGTYTITAFAQNSYNNTVSKVYTYSCVNVIDENPGDTNPQPVTSTTAPTSATSQTSPTSPTPQQSSSTSATSTSQTVTVPDPKLGDVNRDGEINILDATKIQKAVALINVDNYDESLADTDKDGKISVKDATVIMKYVAKMISSI